MTDAIAAIDARLDALKRKCNTGYGCGSACISVKKECRSEGASISKERLRRLQQLAQGEIKPKGLGVPKATEARVLIRQIEGRRGQRAQELRTQRTERSEARRQTATDELDVSTPEARLAFAKRIRERSISRPGASYTGNTLATATLALCDEPGEVGRNARRMAKFLATSNVLTVVDQIKPDSQPQHRGPAREADVKHLMSKDAIAKVRDNEPKMAILVDVISYNKQDIAQSKKTKADLKKGLEELERTTGWDTAYDIQRTRERIKEQDDAIKIAKQTLETSYRTLGIMLMGTPDAAGMAARNGILKMRDDPGWDTPWSAEGLDPTQLQSATQVQVSTYGDIGAKSGYTTGGAPGLGRNQQVMSTFIHEVGHMVQFASGDARNTIPKLPPNLEAAISSDGPGALGGGSLVGDNRFFVSDYSTTNRLEFFAESFVAFVVAPQQLRQRSQEVYDWVDDTLRRANANPVVKPTVAS